ncbi:potassium transporter Kup [Parvibium lacunae]|uniref:Probable potassium transport system protein Kup n=1 Tax=Parvibium lacunae TaxID=1888893 RepID=A0A368L6U5_9BURK|nr:potassium transporter Kup [Parvibium lacunae]RCS59282.1 potassium transporter Kup [Parvibium lacunae]
MEHRTQNQSVAALALGALGVVYGDIGTSPLYTIKEVFAPHTGIALTTDNVIGTVSAIFWALMLVVTLKYVILVLRADNRGEGGTMALLALAVSSVGKSSKKTKWLLLLGTFGASLFYGETVVTPAISVLSAVEGIELVAPSFHPYILPTTLVILVGLFLMQRHGTATVGKLFGPIIVVWFTTLGAIGLYHVIQNPAILAALDPRLAFNFLQARGLGVFLALGAIVLALTGGEALYADMGHFGKKAIQLAWCSLVLPGLALNYLGQGALLLSDPSAVKNPFYLAFPPALLVPALILATLATIIASQAVISGAYSMTQQAIQLGLFPRMQIIHTSATEAGQIYIPGVNWLLLIAVLLAAIGFGSSSALAAAYGIAVTGTMTITTILTFFVIRYGWGLPLWLSISSTLFFFVVDILFFASCTIKFLQGGWFPLLLAMSLLTIMLTWKRGRELLLDQIREGDPKLEPFLESVAQSDFPRAERTAVYLVADPHTVPQAMLHNLKHNMVLHEKNLIMTVVYADVPWVPAADRLEVKGLAAGFWQVTVHYGFMDKPHIPQALELLANHGIEVDAFTTSYFLSRETVVPDAKEKGMARWREQLFAALSRNAGSVVDYFNIPSNAVIELGTRVHI